MSERLDCDVLVVGAGVAGLATALAMTQRGLNVRVCEAADEPRHQGGALLLWSNATRVLAGWGLAPAVHRDGTVLQHTEFRDWLGNMLWTMPVDDWARTHGAPCIIIPRSDFVGTLLAAQADAVQFGWRLADFEQQRGGVVAHSEAGGLLQARLLVGADGIHSRVRQRCFGESSPTETDQIAWIGLSNCEHDRVPPGVAIATVGTGLRFWCAGLVGGRVYWYAIVKKQHQVKDVCQLEVLFRDAHEPIVDIIRATPLETVVATPLQDRPPVPGWSQGSVTLVGDAAHASTPDLGQGACQAIESASVLSACVAGFASTPLALREYESLRFRRTAMVCALARSVAEGSSYETPALVRARNLAIRTQLPWVSEQLFEWLLGGGPKAR